MGYMIDDCLWKLGNTADSEIFSSQYRVGMIIIDRTAVIGEGQ